MDSPGARGLEEKPQSRRGNVTTPDLNLSEDQRQFIVENAQRAAYWATLAADAAADGDKAFLLFATQRATAHARAFAGAIKDRLEEQSPAGPPAKPDAR